MRKKYGQTNRQTIKFFYQVCLSLKNNISVTKYVDFKRRYFSVIVKLDLVPMVAIVVGLGDEVEVIREPTA